jgi:threonine/homoserine/homoserine lactone efflux protein
MNPKKTGQTFILSSPVDPMSDFAVLLPFLLFCLVMTATPGPNNAMVLVSGARVGLWRTLPLVCGIACGISLQLAVLGAGLEEVFELIPGFHMLLTVVGAAYILWLSWKIASGGPLQITANQSPPMGFFGGIAFQWINPKSWALAVSASAAYVPLENHLLNLCAAAFILAFLSMPCMAAWAVGGLAFRKLLSRPRPALVFNVTMAVVLVAATLPAILRLAD